MIWLEDTTRGSVRQEEIANEFYVVTLLNDWANEKGEDDYEEFEYTGDITKDLDGVIDLPCMNFRCERKKVYRPIQRCFHRSIVIPPSVF
jgi:hypothetical protein